MMVAYERNMSGMLLFPRPFNAEGEMTKPQKHAKPIGLSVFWGFFALALEECFYSDLRRLANTYQYALSYCLGGAASPFTA